MSVAAVAAPAFVDRRRQPRGNREIYIDAFRGLMALMMVQGHIFDDLVTAAGRAAPWYQFQVMFHERRALRSPLKTSSAMRSKPGRSWSARLESVGTKSMEATSTTQRSRSAGSAARARDDTEAQGTETTPFEMLSPV